MDAVASLSSDDATRNLPVRLLPWPRASRGSALAGQGAHAARVEVVEQASPWRGEKELSRLHDAVASPARNAPAARAPPGVAKEVGEFLDLQLVVEDRNAAWPDDIPHRTLTYDSPAPAARSPPRFNGMTILPQEPMDDMDQVTAASRATAEARRGTKGVAGDILIKRQVAPSELAQRRRKRGRDRHRRRSTVARAILARSCTAPVVGAARHRRSTTAMSIGLAPAGGRDDPPRDLRAPTSSDGASWPLRNNASSGACARSPPHQDGVDIALMANAVERRRPGAFASVPPDLPVQTEFLFLQRNELPDEEEQFSPIATWSWA